MDEPNLVEDYLDSNPASLSQENKQKIADELRISVGEVNKLIEKYSSNWDNIDPEDIS